MSRKLFFSTATLVGTMVGAGFLGIPFVAQKSGFLISLIEMIVIVSVLLFIMIYFGKLVVRTKGIHQFTGYAEMYTGKIGKWIMFSAFAVGMYSTILAYMVGEGQSLSYLVFNNLNYEFYFGILTWIILSALTYYGLKALEEEESIGFILVIFIILLITAIYGWQINMGNLSTWSPENIFAPTGVILFAFLAFSTIPLLKEIVGSDEKTMTKSIIISHIIVFILYTLFTFIVLGYKGTDVPEVATLGLSKIFIILGGLTMFNSYFGSSIILRDTWKFDLKFNKINAWLWTILPCLALFIAVEFLRFNTFTGILNWGAWISGGVMGCLIIYMISRSKKVLFRSLHKK